MQFEGKHVRMLDGLLVTRCHLVRRECMQFGDGDGWRPIPTPTVNDPVHNLVADSASGCFTSEYELLVTE